MLDHQLKDKVARAQQPPKGMQAEIYMFAYNLDAVYAQQEFPSLKWAWSPTETIVNTNCKMLYECGFRGVITWLSNHFFTPVYKMIFEQDPPCMSMAAMKALIDIANWYALLSDTFKWMYSAENPPHVLLKFALDILIMQEVAYHILAGLIARQHRKKKAPWPTLPLHIGLYEIKNFKHADVKAEHMNKYPFDLLSCNPYDPHCLMKDHCMKV